ncbi:22468_t:CDS:2 [Dentiscutata erythropus]|uniref:22468_t:CDS:1 n=1 Tax=Dentiscutata erythropus TaxID=1348616 RepID=A0A9N8WM59_9GLOM|nr:22468_t:CDS:2 [Dentiscutata erythropus]
MKVQALYFSGEQLYYNNIKAYSITLGFGWNDNTFDAIKKEACDELNKQNITPRMVLNKLDELKKQNVEQRELSRNNIPNNIYSRINQINAYNSSISHSANKYFPPEFNTMEPVPLPSFNRLAQRNIYSVSRIQIDLIISGLYGSNSPNKSIID